MSAMTPFSSGSRKSLCRLHQKQRAEALGTRSFAADLAYTSPSSTGCALQERHVNTATFRMAPRATGKDVSFLLCWFCAPHTHEEIPYKNPIRDPISNCHPQHQGMTTKPDKQVRDTLRHASDQQRLATFLPIILRMLGWHEKVFSCVAPCACKRKLNLLHLPKESRAGRSP